MKVCGIVTEYNPMHIGHEYQLNEGKKVTGAEATVLIMSGQFVQRGEPAIVDKFARTEAAIATGIDLVIELPTYFATSSAEYFAHHAMKLLNALGVVTHINFGSESGAISHLDKISEILVEEPVGYCVLLNEYLGEGLSYPKAREKALIKYNEHHQVIDPDMVKEIETPNNILGIEYCKSLKRLNSKIIPTTIKRIGAGYHDMDSHVDVPSATSIRKHIYEGSDIKELVNKMPEASYKSLDECIETSSGPIFVEDIFIPLKHKIITSTATELSTYMDVTEGLENRLKNTIERCYTYDEYVNALLTKRYTRTKIARALLHIYLGMTKSNFTLFNEDMAPYIRVLGFNEVGQSLLKKVKQHNEDLPIIVNARQGYKLLSPLQQKCYLFDLNSTSIYNHLVNSKYDTVMKNDYETPVIRF